MSLDSAIDAMLATVLGDDDTLAGLAPGGVWNGMAPEGVTGVFVTFAFVSAPDDYTLKDRAFTSFNYLVKAIAPGESSAAARLAAAQVDVLLNDATPTLTEGRILNMRRISSHSLPQPYGGETYWHAGGNYLIQATEF